MSIATQDSVFGDMTARAKTAWSKPAMTRLELGEAELSDGVGGDAALQIS